MNTLIKKYNSFIRNYHEIENDWTENEIHDKRVILRRIFPILTAYRINPSRLRNGEKAFKLFGKLRDIQVQTLKLESLECTPEQTEYLVFLKHRELKLIQKARQFCQTNELEFPTISKKSKPARSGLYIKAAKSLQKLMERIQTRRKDHVGDIHRIRIEFKKFRYVVEALSYVEEIDKAGLDTLKLYQDRLGEIQDYEVLIHGMTTYFRKSQKDEESITGGFKTDKKVLLEIFDNELDRFSDACRDVIRLKDRVVDSK